jgi:hypothetical protein
MEIERKQWKEEKEEGRKQESEQIKRNDGLDENIDRPLQQGQAKLTFLTIL